MNKKILLGMLSFCLFLPACGRGGSNGSSPGNSSVTGSDTPSTPGHVVLVIEENRRLSDAFPNGMPYLWGLASTYAYATHYVANAAGSLIDYMWLTSGSGQGCYGWGCPAGKDLAGSISADNIFHEAEANRLSWKLYAEGLPRVGYLGGNTGLYLDRHNPAKYYSGIDTNNIVPFSQFADDLAAKTLPNLAVVVPNSRNDDHNPGVPIGAADDWLQTNIGPLLDSDYFASGGGGLLIITFDESEEGIPPEVPIPNAFVGPNVAKGTVLTQLFHHQSVERLICDQLQVSCPGAGASAPLLNMFAE
jgi:hypothetical protein